MSYLKEYDKDLLLDVYTVKDKNEKTVFFTNDNPLIVEIGSGNGHFLIGKSLEYKDVNFIGIDKKSNRIIRCREKEVKNGLTNIKWITGDAYYAINEMFFDNSIDTIYMIFPDPWPKKRHWKNRLFKSEFIEIFYSKLKNGGKFLFVTDSADYFNVCINLIAEDKRFNLDKSYNLEEFEKTLFGEKWKKEGRSFYSFLLEKL